jgi:hypothetical protein
VVGLGLAQAYKEKRPRAGRGQVLVLTGKRTPLEAGVLSECYRRLPAPSTAELIGRPRPAFKFSIGRGQVIAGWNEAVATMEVGGKRTLIIPAVVGFGARGAGGVLPPNAT